MRKLSGGSFASQKRLHELAQLREDEAEALREAALVSTWVMATEVLWPSVAAKHYYKPAHQPLCDWLDRAEQGAKKAIVLHRSARKCVAAGQRINMADGGFKPVEAVQPGDSIVTLTPEWRLVADTVQAVADNGIEECVQIRLKTGREIVVTTNHPLRTVTNWVDAGELVPGTRVAVARYLPEPFQSNGLSPIEAAILGYLTGDGGTSFDRTPVFTSADLGIVEHFREVLTTYGGRLTKLRGHDYGYSVAGVKALAREHGLLGKKAIEKQIPPALWQASKTARIAFLSAWFDCDGGTGGPLRRELRWYTSSPQLARDGLTLLSSLGYPAHIVTRRVLGLRPSYTITVAGVEASNLASELWPHGRRVKQLAKLVDRPVGYADSWLSRIPEEWRKLPFDPRRGSLTRGLHNAFWQRYSTSRRKLAIVARGSRNESLWNLATSDVSWDEVVAVTPVGPRPTYDLQVQTHSNFLIEEVVTHNTMLLNIARIVRLICLDPNIRIMVMSAYQRTAIDMCQLIKRQFQMNHSFREIFPELAINDPKWGKIDEFTHPARTITSYLDPTLFATYLGAPLISKRCDVWVGDDPVDEMMVANPDMARSTMDKFTQVLPLIDATSDYRQMFFIGTLKSYNDPLSTIMGKAGSSDNVAPKELVGGWDVVIRPISFVPSGDFNEGGEFAFPDENEAAVPHLPNVHNTAMIRELYNECLRNPAQGESYFYREYACKVQAPSDQKFLPGWFETWIDPPQVPPLIFSGVAVDSALKDEQILFRGDNMVVLVGHFDAYGNLYMTDGARSRSWKTEDFRKILLAMADNPKNMGVQNFIKEKIGEGTIFPMVRGWFNKAQKPVVIHPLKVIGQGKKYLRITEALQGPAMGRRIFFVRGQFPEAIHKILVDELVHLGQWGHDDVADALSMFFHPDIQVIPPLKGGMKWKETVVRTPQLSTAWTNPGALAAAAKAAEPPKDSKSPRLSPFGETTILTGRAFESPGPRSSTFGDEDLPWEKM